MWKKAKWKWNKIDNPENIWKHILKHVMATGPKWWKLKPLNEREVLGEESKDDDDEFEDDDNSSDESSSESSSSDDYYQEENEGMNNSYEANVFGEFDDPHENPPKGWNAKSKKHAKKTAEHDSDESSFEE